MSIELCIVPQGREFDHISARSDAPHLAAVIAETKEGTVVRNCVATRIQSFRDDTAICYGSLVQFSNLVTCDRTETANKVCGYEVGKAQRGPRPKPAARTSARDNN